MVIKTSPTLIIVIILSIAFTILLLSLSRYRGKSTPESLRITPTVIQQPTSTPVPTLPPVLLTSSTVLTSPAIIAGTIDSSWMFEGVFNIKLLDGNLKEITSAAGRETVPGSWQTPGPVGFTSTLKFNNITGNAYLSFESDNPSGLPENQKIFQIPVTLSSSTAFSLSDCPENGWVDCMPVVAPSKRPFCEPNFLDWAKINCPQFQGVAY